MDLLKAFRLLLGDQGDDHALQPARTAQVQRRGNPQILQGGRGLQGGAVMPDTSITLGPESAGSNQFNLQGGQIQTRQQPAAPFRPQLRVLPGQRGGGAWGGLQPSTGLDGGLNGSNFLPQPQQQLFQAPQGTAPTYQQRRLEDYYN